MQGCTYSGEKLPGINALRKGVRMPARPLCSSLQNWDVSDPLLPLGGAGLVNAGAFRIDSYRDGHVFDFKFVDAFHAKVLEGQLARSNDGFRDEVGCSADG